MAREATGSIREVDGKYYARVSLGKAGRLFLSLPTCDSEPAAQRRLEVLAKMARRLRAAGKENVGERLLRLAAERAEDELGDVLKAVDAVCEGRAETRGGHAGTTFAEVADSWTSGELARRFKDHVKAKKDASKDRGRLAKYILPVLGPVPVKKVTLEHAERVMSQLPETLKVATRRHVAQVISKLMNYSVFPLRLRDATPIPRGWLPRVSDERVSEAITPKEEAQFLGHTDVPLAWRVLVGFLSREGLRPDEAAALTWQDVDLDSGHIYLDENKTDEARDWPLDASVASTLKWWRDVRKSAGADVSASGAVFCDDLGRPAVRFVRDKKNTDIKPKAVLTMRADVFRTLLRKAGVDRPILYVENDKRRPTKLRDLRGTFISAALANGRGLEWVMDRTGHKTLAMVRRYEKKARTRLKTSGDLLPLDQAIPECKSSIGIPLGTNNRQTPRRLIGRVRKSRTIAKSSPGGGRTLTPSRAVDFKSDTDATACEISHQVEKSIPSDAVANYASANSVPNETNPRLGALRDILARKSEAYAIGDVALVKLLTEMEAKLTADLFADPSPALAPVADLGEARRRQR